MAARLAPLLHQVQRGSTGPRAIYYMACVPPGNEEHQAELALAATSLGWPTDTMILLPAEPHTAAATFVQAVDRLRWLFATSLEMTVLNLDTDAVAALNDGIRPEADRAPVQQLIHPDQDPWALVGNDGHIERPTLRNGLRPSRSGRVTKYPLVFLHGMLGYSLIRMQIPEDCNSFSPLRQFLTDRGFRTLFPQVHPTGGVVARALELREQIRQWTREPVNLIAHSMGGLDARQMITHLGMADQVRSLITVCSPHRGSYLADWFLVHYRNRVPLLLAMEALGVNVDGFRDCTPEACRRFNAITPDMPGVRYFSYGGDVPQSRVSPALRRAWSLLMSTEGPNDGMVSVQSARWGEYLGTLHADHFAQTPDGRYIRAGEDFDALGFYSRLVEDLARRGF
jgi:triacylglycerol lipase